MWLSTAPLRYLRGSRGTSVYILNLRIRRTQGRRERDRAPVKIFFRGPPARVGRQGRKYANRAKGAVRQTAAGHKCRQHDKSITNYIRYYRERQKHMKHNRVPGPLPGGLAPVIFTASPPVVGTGGTVSLTLRLLYFGELLRWS